MEQVPAQPHQNDDDNPGLRVLSNVIRSFEGLPAQPSETSLRRRRNAAGDLETRSAIPLQHVNGAEPTSHEEEASRSARAQEDFIVILTVNRLCRIFTIATLGFGGGWSIMTAETKAPTSAVWVAYICIITDW
jgi:hypothetical protein